MDIINEPVNIEYLFPIRNIIKNQKRWEQNWIGREVEYRDGQFLKDGGGIFRGRIISIDNLGAKVISKYYSSLPLKSLWVPVEREEIHSLIWAGNRWKPGKYSKPQEKIKMNWIERFKLWVGI